MKTIIIIALVLIGSVFSGCVEQSYVGTYTNDNVTITLFDDSTFSIQGEKRGYSGVYEILDGKLYLKHPLVSTCYDIKDGVISDNTGKTWHKQ